MRRKDPVLAGVDNLATVRDELKELRLGLITGPSGVDRSMCPTADVLLREGLTLTALFGAEHGIRGDSQAGLRQTNYRDPEYGLPVYSLYGEVTAPTPEMLENTDAVVFDMQDAGSRYYTYLYTLTRTMKACAACGKPVYVLDRPNPVGLNVVEGNVLSEKFSSFVGEYAVPARYGLTIGEFAAYINVSRGIGCRLTVVPCEGLTRRMLYDDTGLPFVAPSPNLPSPAAALCYVGTCLIEGTSLSEGRGTTKPFELIGAPWLHAPELIERMKVYGFGGVAIRRAFFTPMFSKYSGECCEGIQIHITDPRRFQPFAFTVRLIDEVRQMHMDFTFRDSSIDHLFGDDRLRTTLIGRERVDAYFEETARACAAFKEETRKYRLYE